jgi:hypothetical protein
MARAMQVGRTTLFEWLRGDDIPADLDARLAATIRREPGARLDIEKRLNARVIELGGRTV